MRRDYAWKLGLLVLLVLGCAAVLYFMPVRQGLDLKGGANVILAADQRADSEILNDLTGIVKQRLSAAGLQNVPVSFDKEQREGLTLLLGSREAAGTVKQAVGSSLQWESKNRASTLDITYGEPRAVAGGYELKLNVAQRVDRQAMERAKVVVDVRVNSLGLSETVVQLDQRSNRLIVQLPGVENAAEATQNLIRVARLNFRIDGRIVMDGSDLSKATATYGGPLNAPVLQLQLTGAGSRKFEQVTRENVGKQMGIYLDEEELMNPVINEPIAGGKPYIDFNGRKKIDQVKVYAAQMNSGALPVPLRVLASNTVGPTLGAETIKSSMMAGIVSLIVVLVFMVLFYSVPGLIANVALFVYALLSLALLAALRGVLTLPGIAGVILTIGMAVDGNIIIFERIKDEMRNGKRPRAAIEAGFARAFWPIFDSNVTTIMTGAVLFFLGSTLVKGFATTLVLGVCVSMFTVLVVTRLVLGVFVDRNPERFVTYFGA